MAMKVFVSVGGALLVVIGIFVWTVVHDEFLGCKGGNGGENEKAKPEGAGVD